MFTRRKFHIETSIIDYKLKHDTFNRKQNWITSIVNMVFAKLSQLKTYAKRLNRLNITLFPSSNTIPFRILCELNEIHLHTLIE